MMKTLVGVDPGAAACVPPFAGLHRITRADQFILRTKSRDQPVGNTRERLGENADLAPCGYAGELGIRRRSALKDVSHRLMPL